jgi:hypothetical protein
VDELLALADSHRIDSLVVVLEQAIDQKSARDGEASLSDEERVVLAVEALEREVNNGGYSQFFINSSVEYAPIVVDALRKIGCEQTAEITDTAIAALGVTDLSPESIDAAFADDDEVRDRALADCDGQYYEAGEDIAGRLFAFVRTHRDAFKL